MHFDSALAGAFAGWAAAAFDIEAEMAGLEAAFFRFREVAEEVSDDVVDAGVGGGSGGRGGSDGRLIDSDDLVDLGNAFDAVVEAGRFFGEVLGFGECFAEDVFDEGAFA